jgi:hypothetical protein
MNSASVDNEALSGALEGSRACSGTDVSRDDTSGSPRYLDGLPRRSPRHASAPSTQAAAAPSAISCRWLTVGMADGALSQPTEDIQVSDARGLGSERTIIAMATLASAIVSVRPAMLRMSSLVLTPILLVGLRPVHARRVPPPSQTRGGEVEPFPLA